MNVQPKVFITHIPQRKDSATGDSLPVVNVQPAAEHGEIVVMMPAKSTFYASADLVRSLRVHLDGYNYERGDSIVALGDPSIIAVAFAVLGKDHGRFKVLKWDKTLKRYVATHVNVA